MSNSSGFEGKLEKRWLKSREESTADSIVYRNETFPFPPSRVARDGFEFQDGGCVLMLSPGPDDGYRKEHLRWRIVGRRMEILTVDDKVKLQYQIETLEADRLTLRPI